MKYLLFITLIAGSLTAQGQRQVLHDGIPSGSTIFAYYEGRTACKEISTELKLDFNKGCAKRKISLTLYVDTLTKKPTSYEIRGLGMQTGTGKWSMESGMPANPQAIVYRLHMGEVDLLLLKGDEQVLFVLDKNKGFLLGNAQYGYTLNRVNDRESWRRWRELVHRGLPF